MGLLDKLKKRKEKRESEEKQHQEQQFQQDLSQKTSHILDRTLISVTL